MILNGILQKIIRETVERAMCGYILSDSSKKKTMTNRQNVDSTVLAKNVIYMLRIVVNLTPSLQFKKRILFLPICSSVAKETCFSISSLAGEFVRASFSCLTIRFIAC